MKPSYPFWHKTHGSWYLVAHGCWAIAILAVFLWRLPNPPMWALSFNTSRMTYSENMCVHRIHGADRTRPIVVLIGSSQAYSGHFGDRSSLVARLEDKLKHNIQVYNFAIEGGGIYSLFPVLLDALEFHPDAIIFGTGVRIIANAGEGANRASPMITQNLSRLKQHITPEQYRKLEWHAGSGHSWKEVSAAVVKTNLDLYLYPRVMNIQQDIRELLYGEAVSKRNYKYPAYSYEMYLKGAGIEDDGWQLMERAVQLCADRNVPLLLYIMPMPMSGSINCEKREKYESIFVRELQQMSIAGKSVVADFSKQIPQAAFYFDNVHLVPKGIDRLADLITVEFEQHPEFSHIFK
ncbi:SGNH/GDSL hydrolase family protein [Planctomycetota bacterium]